MKKFIQTGMFLLLPIIALAQTFQFNEPQAITTDSMIFHSQKDFCGPESACQGDLITMPNPVCPGSTVTMKASPTQGLPPYTYLWYTGATTQTITGQFWSQTDIWVQVTGADGCSWFADGTIFMNTNGVTPTISGNPAFCSGSSTTLTASGTGTFSWTGPNNFTSTNQSIAVTVPGMYTVTVNNGGCSGTASVNVTMNQSANVSISGPNGFCPGMSAQLTASSNATNATYTWNTGQFGPTLMTSIGGTYTVTVNAPGFCASTATKAVVAFPAPSPKIKVSYSNNIATLSVLPGLSALWSTGATTPTITSPNGTYSVTVTDANGCMAFSTPVELDLAPCAPPCPLPVAGFTFSMNGQVVTFTNTSTNATSYQWQFGNGNNSMAMSPTHVYQPGTYTVTMTATNACGSSTTTQTVNITCPTPTAGFNFSTNGANVNFTNTSTNAISYLWNFGDGTTSTAQNPTHTYGASGTYTVTLTATNNCGSVSISKTLNLSFCMQGITNNQGVPNGGTFCPNGQFILTAPHPANPTTTYTWSAGQMVGASWQALASTTPGVHSYWVTEMTQQGVLTQYCFEYEVDCNGMLQYNEVNERATEMSIYPNPTPSQFFLEGAPGVYILTDPQGRSKKLIKTE